LRTFQGAEKLVRSLEFNYHGLLALASAPVPLGLLALGLARWGVGRRRPLLFSGAALACCALWLLSFPWQHSLVAGSAIAPSLLAWMPNLFVGLVAVLLVVTRRSPRLQDPPTFGPPAFPAA